MNKTIVLALVILIILAVACAPAPTPVPPPPPATTAPSASSAPSTSSSAQPTAVATKSGAVTQVKIGSIHPLTGGLAQDGAFLKNSIDLAVDEINSAGGIKSLGGAKLVVEQADSQGKPEVAQSEAERLIRAGDVALIGAYQSAATFNATQVAEREQVPFVIDVAVSNNIMERGFKYTFRIQPNQTAMAKGAGDGLKALGIKTVVMLHEDSIFGQGQADIFKKMAGDYGITVLGDISYSLNNLTDLTTEVSKVQALKPDAVLVTGYLNDGVLMARTAKDLKLNVKAIFGIASGAFSTPQFVDAVKDTANYFFDANYHWDASNPKAQQVRDRYKAKFNSEMPTHGVMAYEATMVLADAIERAASTDPKTIRDALAKTNFANHILPYDGPIRFDANGEAVNARAIVMQVQNGNIVQVLPKQFAQKDPIFPMPAWDNR
ncbi:MAG: ABC transporter substrate-binding protein [Chloroflexi bacterium]|nr:ABC transporter substrate-binding protein [Chloroflexota bacterium]